MSARWGGLGDGDGWEVADRPQGTEAPWDTLEEIAARSRRNPRPRRGA